MDRSARSGTSAETCKSAVRGVTTVLAAVAIVVVGSARPGQETYSPFLVAGVVAVLAVTVELTHRRIQGRSGTGWRSAVHLQTIDLAFFVPTSVAVQVYVVEAAWALLAIPIVLASIRFGARGAMCTWSAGSAAYLAALQIPEVGLGAEAATAVGRLGVLLAIAASLALLARWLQEGWLHQADLTRQIESRLDRLAVIESATGAMRAASPTELVSICLDHVVHLGFDAAMATRGAKVIAATGARGAEPSETNVNSPPFGEIRITTWTTSERTDRHSASLSEPLSGITVTAWSNEPIDDDSARALGELVAATTKAVEAAIHLDHARHQATHDPLTNLANRRTFNDELEVATTRPRPVAVLSLNLDDLEANTESGEDRIRDRYLVVAARHLQRAVGDHGLVGRIDDNEFAILLTGPAARHGHRLGRDLASAFRRPVVIDGLQLRACVSIGVADGVGPANARTLVHQAAMARKRVHEPGPRRTPTGRWRCGSNDPSSRPREGPKLPA
ncbi:MAG: GGDEF domain-containing protein [Actinomycetota bacterium]